MVVEGVDARATTEEEETRCGDAAASFADAKLERAAAEEAAEARGTATAALLLLLAAPRKATAEAREEDASVVCIFFGKKKGNRARKRKKKKKTSEADLRFFLPSSSVVAALPLFPLSHRSHSLFLSSHPDLSPPPRICKCSCPSSSQSRSTRRSSPSSPSATSPRPRSPSLRPRTWSLECSSGRARAACFEKSKNRLVLFSSSCALRRPYSFSRHFFLRFDMENYA